MQARNFDRAALMALLTREVRVSRWNQHIALVALLLPGLLAAQDRDQSGRPLLDRSKPVPSKAQILAAWQKRQDAVGTARFVWTEQETMPTGWLSNPRFPERERTLIPALVRDRTYSVSKTLAVDANKMRYSFEIDRPEEPDGVRVVEPSTTRSDGLGVRRNYVYVSVFDGHVSRTSLSSRLDSPPPVVHQELASVDAQNLDTRPFLLAIRPLDSVMGLRLVDRAVTNELRAFYNGRSTMILEERHDPSGWKTLLWIEPERDFLISRFGLSFEQKLIVQIDIDYIKDAQWSWIPSGWRITEMLADGSTRTVTVAKVSSYSINVPVGIEGGR